MRSQQHYQLKISTLCPVHIGCDEVYEPTNYVIDNDALFEFNSQDAIQALTPAQREQLDKLVSGRPDENMIKGVQSFFYKHREGLLAYAGHFIPVNQGVASLYQKRIGKAAQIETGGRQVINKLEIERTFYNPVSRQPILPGSSIKGAMRTALLSDINQGKPLQRNQRGQDECSRELQQRLFNYRDMHQDPMRLVQVGDAHWAQNNVEAPTEVRFAVNRAKKIKQKDGRLLQSMAEERGLFQLLECVSGMQAGAFDMQFTLQTPGFNAPGKLPDKNLRWSFQDIARICNAFYLPKLQKELKLLLELGYADEDWLRQTRLLLSGYQTRFDQGQILLLRLGRHSGAESVTLDGIRSIKIMGGKKGKDSYEKEARTLWLAASDEKSRGHLMPFGWVLIEQGEPADGFYPQQERQTWAAAIRHKQQVLKNSYQKQQAEALAKQHQAEEQAKAEAKAEAQRQQQLETAKQSMTPLAGEFYEQSQQNNWEADKNAFMEPDKLENWVNKWRESQDDQLKEQLLNLLEIHFRGILANPDKVKGKKQKPVYSPRASQACKTLQGKM